MKTLNKIINDNGKPIVADWVPEELLLWADNFDKTTWDKTHWDKEISHNYRTQTDHDYQVIFEALEIDMAKMIDVIEEYFTGYSVDYTAKQIAAAYYVSMYSPYNEAHSTNQYEI